MMSTELDNWHVNTAAQLFVWHISLDVPSAVEQALAAALSDDERVRAERFRFDRDRRRFVVARSILRSIIGSFLRRDPHGVRFRYSDRGKPFVVQDSGACPPFFNVAHSGDYGLVAVATGGEVGVDIEAIRPLADGDDIATRFFSPGEAAAIQALPPPLRHAAFFQCWTRKEAYIKALGEGLSCPLASFEVSIAPDGPARLLRIAGDASQTDRWWMHDVSDLPNYAAAVALRRAPARLHVRWWRAENPSALVPRLS